MQKSGFVLYIVLYQVLAILATNGPLILNFFENKDLTINFLCIFISYRTFFFKYKIFEYAITLNLQPSLL